MARGFNELTEEELLNACQFFGVEVAGDADKDVLVSALAKEKIKWSEYKDYMLTPEEKVEPVEVVSPQDVDPKTGILLYMNRPNASLNIHGYVFTKKHPFVTVSADEADYIVQNYDGIRPALPSEAERYYS